MIVLLVISQNDFHCTSNAQIAGFVQSLTKKYWLVISILHLEVCSLHRLYLNKVDLITFNYMKLGKKYF
jgi:hypothetical protein